MDGVNLGYVVHNGSFALLGLLFLALGGCLPPTTRRWARSAFVLLDAAALAPAYPMAFQWEGYAAALPWAAATLALPVHGLDRAHGGRT